jgi:molybdopterin molybdotransferase
MLSVEEALERILSYMPELDAEEKPILDAMGQVLADDVVSDLDIPPLDNSAMDGYALQATSVETASEGSPVVLRVTGVIAAGQLPEISVGPGEAVRIMTGAPVPEGADTVVPFEETDELERRASGQGLSEIAIKVAAKTGRDVRVAGQDVRRGEVVLKRGAVLRPSEVGVIASLGRNTVRVIRKPVVGILSTGDELLEPGANFGTGGIYDSNSYSVAALVRRYGGIPHMLGIARDNLDSVNAKLREGLESDILITSAGVSKGDYDMVKDVLTQHGEIDFWSVRMKPAKPLAFGVLTAPDGRKVPHLGLPGNPVSAMVAFEQFGRAAIYKMLGKTGIEKPQVRAILDEPIHNTDGRRVFARAVVTKRDGEYRARLTGEQGSNLLTSMARANGLAICPEDLSRKEAGEVVDVQMLDWPEEVF